MLVELTLDIPAVLTRVTVAKLQSLFGGGV